jgi:hypothetical protein
MVDALANTNQNNAAGTNAPRYFLFTPHLLLILAGGLGIGFLSGYEIW